MASIYPRKRSPFYWIKFRDPETNKIKRESTGYRVGIGSDTRKAKEYESQKTLEERKLSTSTTKEQWDNWVPAFIKSRYRGRAGSLLRYTIAWKTLRLFLTEFEIALPRQLTRENCENYFEWREKPDVKNGKYKAQLQTALTEIKFLGVVMGEAIIRKYATINPCHKLGIERPEPKERPEYSDEDYAIIEQAILNEPDEKKREFFTNSLAIARYHGVRISETYFNPMTEIELWTEPDSKTNLPVTHGFMRLKQKGSKKTNKPLHPKLIPMFQALQKRGAKETYPRPKSPSKEWFNLLHRCGIKERMPNACFHSTRVSVASRLARNNDVSERKAMEYMSHASTTVHKAYVRWRPEDVADCHDSL